MTRLLFSLAPVAASSAIFMAALTASSCSGFGVDRISSTGQKTQAVAASKGLAVETRNGNVTLTKDPAATEVQVTSTIKCGGATQAEADKRAQDAKLKVETQPDGNVRVTVDFPACADGRAHASNDGASFQIRAAQLHGINILTSNGQVMCDGFDGQLNVRSSNGSIKVDNHNGPVQADTSNGSVQATNVAGPVDLESSNGSIAATLSSGSSQNVTVRSSNGNVKVDLPESWNGQMNAQTSNGQVTVKADQGRANNVSASQGRGSATIGNGNATATLRTSNGSVVVTVKGSQPAT